MGLTVSAKCLNAETGFDCGYVTYGRFIMELVRAAYGERCYEIYRASFLACVPFDEEAAKYWNSVRNEDLDLLIFHSDCDGKFTWQECKRIYLAMKDLKSDMQGHNYGVMEFYNMFEHWKNMFYQCWKHRNTMYYS